MKCTGGDELRGKCAWLVIGSFWFSAFRLWTVECFHEYWDEVIARLTECRQMDLVQRARSKILLWNENRQWTAHWYSAGGSDKVPGETSYSAEALELIGTCSSR